MPFGRRLTFVLLLLGCGAGCRAGGCIANVLGDVVGETGDAHCDRRYVAEGREAAPFCQEIIDTIAQGEFEDDCRDKFAARADDGRCPRENVIGGCKISKVNDDGSEIWDWYYDISPIERDAGDGTDRDGGIVFNEAPRTKAAVQKLCADRQRYDEGASYADP